MATTIGQLSPASSVGLADKLPLAQYPGGIENDVNCTPQQILSLPSTPSMIAVQAQGSSPVSGGTVNIPNGCSKYIIRGSGTLASLTINLPAAQTANHDLTIIFQVGVTNLTVNPASGYSMINQISGAQFMAGSRIIMALDGTVWC